MTDPLVRKIIDTDLVPTDTLLERRNTVYSYLSPVSYLTARRHRPLFMRTDGILMDGGVLCLFVRMLYGYRIRRPAFVMEALGPVLFSRAAAEKRTVYIVGGLPGEAETAAAALSGMYPGLGIAGLRNGYFASDAEKEKEYARIIGAGPDYVLAGMGLVAQEEFLLGLKAAGYEGIGFACGGFVSQTSMKNGSYYPKWINRMNIRFLYRMYREKHTRKRYLKAALLFPPCFLADRLRYAFRRAPVSANNQ